MLSDRLIYLLIGCGIGFVFGYIVARLREIATKVDHVDETLNRKRNEEGKISDKMVARVALGLVVLMTAFAAFSSQSAVNKTADVQKQQAQNTYCIQQILSETVNSLNERTQFSSAQATANIKLQKSQLQYVTIFTAQPQPTQKEAMAAFDRYIKALSHFVSVAGQTRDASEQFPFPTNAELASCLRKPPKE